MKILIVDDEPYIRKGIIKKINWEKLGAEVLEASDGLEALEIIDNNHIDIILTDIRMPGMDGIEFVKTTKKKYKDKHKIIVVSGYGEFEYACELMKYGIKDYILKPIKDIELEELIANCIKEIKISRKNKQDIENTYKKNKELSINALLNKLIDNSYGKDFIKQASQVGISFNYMYQIVLICSIEPNDNSQSYNIEIKNILNNIFSAYKAYIFDSYYRKNDIVLLVNLENPGEASKMDVLAIKAISSIRKKYSVDLTISIGNVCSNINDIYKSYSVCFDLLKEKLLKGTNKVFNINSFKYTPINFSQINKYKKVLKYCINEKNWNDTEEIIEKMVTYIKNNSIKLNYKYIEELFIDIYALLYNSFVIEEEDIYLYSEKNFIRFLGKANSLEEILQFFKDMLTKRISNNNQTQSNEDIINEIIKYINDNYGDDITLQSISDKYYMHPNYFCRFFKDHVGETFGNYLTKIRMEKSLELIKNHKIKLVKIAEMVGYKNARYFSQVFKKYYGKSPSEYY